MERMRPYLKIALGFLGVILVGTGLLLLPASHARGESLTFLEALFSASSAVCVTGLSIVEIGAVLSPFGQGVMLLLIQVGGLGFMTATSIVFMLLGRRISLSERVALQESMNETRLQGVVRMTRRAIWMTLSIEAAGAVLLSFRFIPLFGWGKGLWYSIFHAISAFCNAGFDVFGRGDSLAQFAGDGYVLGVIMALIVLGGLGFIVIADVGKWLRTRRRLLLQTKIVLAVSAGLLLFGAVFFTLFEWDNAAAGGETAGEKLLFGMFQSVTVRTAGFATVPQGSLRPVSGFLSILLMFTGASPAGTGGGIKTTTVAVLAAMLAAVIRGRESAVLFRRRVNRQLVLRAFAIAMLGMLFVVLAAFCISAVEYGRISAQHILYEVTSAFATVGLSQGITAQLSPLSQALLILSMYAGRVGLMTLVLGIAGRFSRRRGNIEYPEEKIMIG